MKTTSDLPRETDHLLKERPLLNHLGYATDLLDELPESIIHSFEGIGNPFVIAPIKPGATIVDMGAGSGLDSCIAGFKTGGRGKVYGIDKHLDKLEKARAATKALWLRNVLFIHGNAKNIPLPSDLADVVISNGIGRYCTNKKAVFCEIFRILRSGGHLQWVDVMAKNEGAENPLLELIRPKTHLTKRKYQAALEAAGFEEVEVSERDDSLSPELSVCHVFAKKINAK